jgi:hypothetical protein
MGRTMHNQTQCALCAAQITPEIDSGEHILLQALGGRKEVRGFICRPCNSRAGDSWDVELTRQLAHISIMHGVHRQRSGDLPSLTVRTAEGGELLMHADGSMTPARPSVNKVKTETGWSISAVARTVAEAENIIQGVAKRYPNSNAMDALDKLSVKTEYNKQPLTFNLQVGGLKAGRSIVKTAVAMAHSMGIGHRDCPAAMRYLLGDDDAPQFGHFHERDLIADRPDTHLIHCVSVKGDPSRRTLLGYVEYFSLARLVILLSDDYSGPAVQRTYTIDPSTGAEVSVTVDLDLGPQDLQVLGCAEYRPEPYMRTFNQVFPVLMRRNEERSRTEAIEAAFRHACEKLGVQPGGEVRPDQFQQFSAHFAEHVVPFVMANLRQDAALRALGDE